jgi:hypothetical protein
VEKSRVQLDRAIGTRGVRLACCLMLASALLAGCHGTSTSSTATGATSAAASASSTTSATGSASSSTPVSSSSSQSTPAPTGKSVDVTWTAPTTNTDGSALTDLAGYRIYYGTSPSALSNSVDVPNAGASDYVVQGLSTGTWYFAVAAYTNTGLESSYSSVVSQTIS